MKTEINQRIHPVGLTDSYPKNLELDLKALVFRIQSEIPSITEKKKNSQSLIRMIESLRARTQEILMLMGFNFNSLLRRSVFY